MQPQTATFTGEVVAITPSRDNDDPHTAFVTVAVDIADIDGGSVTLTAPPMELAAPCPN